MASIEGMPDEEICSFCWLNHLAIMQRSSYSVYGDFLKSRLEYSYQRCGKYGDTSIPPPLIDQPEPTDFCVTEDVYTASAGDTCNSIAISRELSSAALYFENPSAIKDCNEHPEGVELCLPLACEVVYVTQPGDTCFSVESNYTQTARVFAIGYVTRYNSWVEQNCGDLHAAGDAAFGHVLCLSPQSGRFSSNSTIPDVTTPHPSRCYTNYISPPPQNAAITDGTTPYCGIWHVVGQDGDTCPAIALRYQTTITIFMEVNPTLGTEVAGFGSALVGRYVRNGKI